MVPESSSLPIPPFTDKGDWCSEKGTAIGYRRGYSNVGLGMLERKSYVFLSHVLCPKKNNKNDRENLGVMGIYIPKAIILKDFECFTWRMKIDGWSQLNHEQNGLCKFELTPSYFYVSWPEYTYSRSRYSTAYLSFPCVGFTHRSQS